MLCVCRSPHCEAQKLMWKRGLARTNFASLPIGSAVPNTAEGDSQLCNSCSQPHFHTHSRSMLPLHKLQHSVHKPHFSAWPPKRARTVHATSMEQEASISYAESVSLVKKELQHPCLLPASRVYL